MLRLPVYDHEDNFLFELGESEVFALRMRETINGEHRLDITTTRLLEKGMRILTKDATEKWREWVVTSEDQRHRDGDKMTGDYMAVWSLQHDLSVSPISKMAGTSTNPVRAIKALEDVLSGTSRWQIGTVTLNTIGSASMYRTTAWSALSTLVAVWGGEVDATIEVGSTGVTARKVDLLQQQGSSVVTRRFDYGADMSEISRKVDSTPKVCRIIPLGRGEATETGGYGRKVTIGDVNGGIDYLENSSVVELVRLPTDGGWEYPTAYVENPNAQTPEQLLEWAQGILEEATNPQVTYGATVLQLSQAGMDVYGIGLGDVVHCVDRKFTEQGLRVSGRVSSIDANLLDPSDTQVTIGRVTSSLISRLNASVNGVNVRIDEIIETGAFEMTPAYLERLLDKLNNEINIAGGYTYITQGEGLRTYDVAVSDPLVGAEATRVVEIKGGNIRIANSKTSSGDWEWRTVLEAGHIASDLIESVNITAGRIRSADGGTDINLDQSTVRLGTANGMHIQIDAGQLGFWQGDVRVAYVDGEQLYIPKSVVLDRMQVGMEGNACWEWVIEDSGNMSLKWVG